MTISRNLLVFFGLLLFAILCYGWVVPAYFLSDDFTLIGAVIRHGMFYAWVSPGESYLRPGVIFSYFIDHQLWGLNPVGYHLSNIFFHGLAAFALFLIAQHLLRKVRPAESPLASILVACLFTALVSHSESVSWIAGRTDVVAVALGLTGTASFIALFDKRSLPHAIIAVVLLAVSLLTKEAVAVLPFIWCALFLHHWWLHRRFPPIPSAIVLGLSFVLLAMYFVLRLQTFGSLTAGHATALYLMIWNNPVMLLEVLYRLTLRIFLPALPLRLYELSQEPVSLWLAGFSVGLLAMALFAQPKWFRAIRWTFVFLIGAIFVISLAPILPLQINLYETQGERCLYLPSAFACLLLVYFVTGCTLHKRLRTIGLLVFISFQAISLQWANQRWIVASELSRKIAAEVSTTDPASTVILNIPDNFRGAYLFRNGLNEAATLFVGKETEVPYRSIVSHDVYALDDMFEARADSSTVILSLPDNLREDIRYSVHELGFHVDRGRWSIAVTDTSGVNAEIVTFLSFRSGTSNPILQMVRRDRQR